MTRQARVGVLVYDGVSTMDAMGPYDVFATAGRGGAPLDAGLVTATTEGDVESATDVTFEPDRILDPHDPPSVLVVPGGGWNKRRADGAWAAAQRTEVTEAIATAHEHGALLACVGTGALLAAEAGLLSGRRATTDPAARGALAEAGAEIVDARIVDDGDVVSAPGDVGGIDLACWLLERQWGPSPADTVASMIEHERSTDVATA